MDPDRQWMRRVPNLEQGRSTVTTNTTITSQQTPVVCSTTLTEGGGYCSHYNSNNPWLLECRSSRVTPTLVLTLYYGIPL